MVPESHVKLCVAELDFPEKNILPSKMGKLVQNGPKTGFFQFIGKCGDQFLLNLIYNENLYYLLFSCTNPILRKIFVPDVWARVFSANQIAGFFNQPYLQNKSMKQLIYCMLIQVLLKVKLIKNLLGSCGQKWVWALWSKNYISRLHRRSKQVFQMGNVKNRHDLLVHETVKFAIL